MDRVVVLENEQFTEVFCPRDLGLLTLMRIRGPLNPWRKKTRFWWSLKGLECWRYQITQVLKNHFIPDLGVGHYIHNPVSK